MFNVKVAFDHKAVNISICEPVLLSTLLTDNDIPFEMPCAGNGKCLKCKIRAVGSLSDITELEVKALSDEERAKGIRLSCMTYVSGNADIYILDDQSSSQIVSNGYMPLFSKNPLGSKFGIAIDIGTTTVAAYLYDLHNFEQTGCKCALNPQKLFGADVISRIEKSLAGNAEKLADGIIHCIEQLSIEMCEEQCISPNDVDSMVITGNTTMLYLLTKSDVTCLSHAPFKATKLFGAYIDQYGLSIPAFSNAVIYLPKCISAYVGADITTAILSSGMTTSDICTILVDIGTNGEMALQFSGKLWCCSTAAGPAFEGTGIHMGMNASAGAIDHVFADDGTIRFTTIGDAPACGICGSGIIDATAVFVRMGIIDETGRFQEKGHRFEKCICKVNNDPAFYFENSDVVITQKDISEIQLAKSAICAGLKTLLHQAEIDPSAVDKFYIAGGFGSFINVDSAVEIGLFPAQLKSKAVVLGNAAGMGACMILLSEEMKDKSLSIANGAETVELSISRYFMDSYIDSMMF